MKQHTEQNRLMMVGPVLRGSEVGNALVEAIEIDNEGRKIEIQDRGGYIRVLVEGYCVITKETAEEVVGREFKMPGDLEIELASFVGRINPSSRKVEFTAHKA